MTNHLFLYHKTLFLDFRFLRLRLFFFAFLLSWTRFLLVLDETEFTCPSQSEQQDLVKAEICRIRGVIAGGHGRNWKKQSYVVLGTS